MRIAVLGTGMVGQALATRLVGLGHDVLMGSRTAGSPGATAWAGAHAERAAAGTFADAARHGEVVVNATSGAHSIEALEAAGTPNLAGKVLVDVTNPMVPGEPVPALDPVASDSLAEQIQRAFPDARVVKTLNSVNCDVMVDPTLVEGDHDVFVSGDDPDAKAVVRDLLRSFGWPDGSIVDLGGLVAARGQEAYLLFWVAVRMTMKDSRFNIKVVR